ncbi:hypothetical protein GCM10010995_08760 [Cysteiniphilum litorale]|uniref:Uncharacterized protein n=1 Tax=Cysteiniphilum litorale TaxID=2056700 RepID=A0A8J3E8G6_9GAMM|nr:hypothetical protein [Cysteiniphilum sp. SYW-8]GGF93788.1 hypothetical protein GCM10010995_08760 [Cysteiniphilum litorale]
MLNLDASLNYYSMIVDDISGSKCALLNKLTVISAIEEFKLSINNNNKTEALPVIRRSILLSVDLMTSSSLYFSFYPVLLWSILARLLRIKINSITKIYITHTA